MSKNGKDFILKNFELCFDFIESYKRLRRKRVVSQLKPLFPWEIWLYALLLCFHRATKNVDNFKSDFNFECILIS